MMHANLIAPIPESEGYFATRGGKIISTRFNKAVALRPAPNREGRWSVVLWKNKKQKTISVHRLVLTAFNGYPKEGEECLHLNNDPADNRIANLRWGTHQENVDQMHRDGRAWKGKFTEEERHQMRTMPGSQREVARKFGVSQSYISLIRSAGRSR